MKRIFIVVVVIIALVAVAVWVFIFGNRKSGGSVRTEFVGYTNVLAGERMATFRISNGRPWPILLATAQPEVKTPAGWPSSGIPKYGALQTIPPGKSVIITVAIPTKEGIWRVPLFHQKRTGRLEGIVEDAMNLIFRIPNESNKGYGVFTPEITL
jgi:hypothetical protein